MSEKQIYTFTNSAGETFEISPLNPLEEEIIRARVETEWKMEHGALPEPPAFEIKTESGEVSRVPLKSIKDADTPELQEAWKKYEADTAELSGLTMLRFVDSCYLNVRANPDDYPGWKFRMRALRVEIPEDEVDRFFMFCKTWVIRSKEDIVGLIIASNRTIANVSDEVAQAAEAMFQRAVEKAAADLGSAEGTGGR